jgi:quercetin dioxygenase-like cupin family protein
MEIAAHTMVEWAPAPEEHFTGQVSIAPMSDAAADGLRVSAVRFAPGARTDWHSHPGGQVLHVVSGHGRVATADGIRVDVEAGDTVTARPGELHWHGASADTEMTHLSIIDGHADWADKVTDEEYEG